jgi:hypothetical protein
MAEERLHTLLHVSDLHFGVPPANTPGGQPPTQWRHLKLADGWLGHNDSALVHLEDFALDLADESPTLVVTGDLTACGKVSEFEMARDYLIREIALPSRVVGLRVPTLLARTISGNHDQWPGSIRVIGNPTSGLAATFPPPSPGGTCFPIRPVHIPLTKGRRLSILGIDSDADVWPLGITRFLARGKFLSQLIQLSGILGPKDPNEIRVLMIHHSPAYSRTRKLAIDKSSMQALWAFIKQHHVSVLLTGHIHLPYGIVKHVTFKGARWPVLEARCGTTTQTDVLPLNWVAHGTHNESRFPTNSLLVHRLFETGKSIEWRTDLMSRCESGYSKTFWLTGPIKVWP